MRKVAFILIRHRPQLITYLNNKHIHRATKTVKQTREIEAQRNKAESNINITMESESTEQNVVLRGNEDLMSTSNTSTNDGTCNPNGCTKKTVSIEGQIPIIALYNVLALYR